MMISDAILLGAGHGKRFAGQRDSNDKIALLPKQFQVLGNAPIFIHSLRALLRLNHFRQIVVVFPKEYLQLAQEEIDKHIDLNSKSKTIIRVIEGGERRQDSSYQGIRALEQLSPLPTRVVIHDACRPFLSRGFLARIDKVLFDRAYGAWVPVVPVAETLKRVENQQVVETVDRALVQRVQTPQVFEYSVIRSLSEKVHHSKDLNFTDDAALCEYYGIPVGTYEGDVRNIKVTYDFELDLLQNVMREEPCAPESDTTYTA